MQINKSTTSKFLRQLPYTVLLTCEEFPDPILKQKLMRFYSTTF